MTVAKVIDMASAVVVAFAFIGAAVTLVATRRRMVALSVLLDLLIAAGLLHLAANPNYKSAVSAGVILAIRRLVSWSLASERNKPVAMTREPPTKPGAVPETGP